MNTIIVLGSIILALLSLVFYLYQKKTTADALLKNNDVKDQINALDGQIAKNQGLIDAEKEELERKKKEDVSKDTLLDFLNKNRK